MRETTDSVQLVVFARGMASFGHNRGTKADQERLLSHRVDPRHGFLGAFDDSGNYAFASSLGIDSAREAVLTTLNTKYAVSGVVVVDRPSLAAALEHVERRARELYGKRFDDSEYSVREPSGLWRLGLVFTDADVPIDAIGGWLEGADDRRLRRLTVMNGIFGVLKYDQGKRLPWGEPADLIADALPGDGTSELLATGRSGRTVRGVLRLFGGSVSPAGKRRVARVTSGYERGPGDGAQPLTSTGGPMPTRDRQESCDEIEGWLRKHAGLKKAGPAMVDTFVALAREVCETTRGQIVPREAGEKEAFIPFSRRGTEQNLADTMKFREGAIELVLKVPEGKLHEVDPQQRTEPSGGGTGRWAAYNRGRRFVFQDRQDIPFVKQLIVACVPRLPEPPVPGSQPHTPPPETELDFRFVQSESLRTTLGRYWEEARATARNGQWLSSTILCGSVAEGMLVGALVHDEKRAKEQYVSLSRRGKLSDDLSNRIDRVDEVPPASQWLFGVLIKVAGARGLLSDGTEKACESLRSKRNLIHPARARDEITKSKAETAQSTVRECHEDLEKRLRRT